MASPFQEDLFALYRAATIHGIIKIKTKVRRRIQPQTGSVTGDSVESRTSLSGSRARQTLVLFEVSSRKQKLMQQPFTDDIRAALVWMTFTNRAAFNASSRCKVAGDSASNQTGIAPHPPPARCCRHDAIRRRT